MVKLSFFKKKSRKKIILEKVCSGEKNPIIRQSTRRFVLQPGFACNLRCSFCYYLDSVKSGTTRDHSTEKVKSMLREAKSLGLDQVDISGGEPTIRSDIFEIVKYAREIGFIKVCVITNGIRMADKEYTHSLIKAGVNEVLFSTHGTNAKEHDSLTNVLGSFNKLWSAIKNVANESDAELKFNITLTNLNYKNCSKLFELLKPYNPSEVNLLVFNPSQEACKAKDRKVRFANYNEIGEEIASAIDKYKNIFKVINVRWIPYCILKGYEGHIRTMWQKMFEDQEWDPYLNIKYNKTIWAVVVSFLVGLFLYPFRAPKYGQKNLYTKFNLILSSFRQIYYYRHLKQCKKCSLWKICPGLPRDYVEKYNLTKLDPYNLGKIINDPLYFCKDYPKKFTSLRL